MPTSKIFCFAKYHHSGTTPCSHSPLCAGRVVCSFVCENWMLQSAALSHAFHMSFFVQKYTSKDDSRTFDLAQKHAEQQDTALVFIEVNILFPLNVCSLTGTLLSLMRQTPINFKEDLINTLIKGREMIYLINAICKNIYKVYTTTEELLCIADYFDTRMMH